MPIRLSRLNLILVFFACTTALLLTAGCFHGSEEDGPDPILKQRAHAQPHPGPQPSSAPSASSGPPPSVGQAPRPPVGVMPADAHLPDTGKKIDPNDLVGNNACSGCHSAEFQSHRVSRHGNTLHTVDAKSLGASLPPVGPVGDSGFTLAARDKTLYLTQDGRVENGQPLQLALGSGKTGVTYVHVIDPQQLIELRMSYFPQTKQWTFTPGQQGRPDHDVGHLHTGPFVRQCILCHAVKVDAKTGLPPAPDFYGVGCESCHGPGRAHVTAMQKDMRQNIRTKPDADLHIEKIGSLSATRLNRQCGDCHGNGDGAAANAVMPTNRLQPYALMRSRCFQESGKTLSCMYCHNPHADARVDASYYEAKCLSCHTTPTTGTTAPEAAQAAASTGAKPKSVDARHGETGGASVMQTRVGAKTTCPVNPRAGCIECHMPKSPLFPGTKVPTVVPDHFIRIYRPAKP